MRLFTAHTLVVLLLFYVNATVAIALALPSSFIKESEPNLVDINRRIGPVSKTAQKAVDYIRNPKNTAVINNPTVCFYCGRSRGKDGKLSKSYYKLFPFMKKHQCQSVDTVVETMGLTKASLDWTVEDWTEVSRALAQMARAKKVFALVANHLPPDTVWVTVEEPELQANPHVEIIEVWTLNKNGAFVNPRNVKRKADIPPVP